MKDPQRENERYRQNHIQIRNEIKYQGLINLVVAARKPKDDLIN